MVYLIGGPPKCGKTTLTKHFAARRRISWISADTLQNIVWAYTPKARRPSLFPHSSSRPKGNDEFYSRYTPQKIVKNYIVQGKTSYNAISMVAETCLKDEEDCVIEGYQVTPEIVGRICKKFGRKRIRAIFLVKYDEAKFVCDIRKSTTPNDWIRRKTRNAETYRRIANMVVTYSRYFEKQAKEYSFKTVDMSNDFEKKIEEIERYFTTGKIMI